MPQRFFELADDVNVPHRWHLAMPRNSQGFKMDDAQFTDGTPVHIQERLRIPVELAGKPLDFTEAGLRIPVAHVRVASMWEYEGLSVNADRAGKSGGVLLNVQKEPLLIADPMEEGTLAHGVRSF
jgi:hypothetical protein